MKNKSSIVKNNYKGCLCQESKHKELTEHTIIHRH